MAGVTGTLRSVNPATGEELASFSEHTAEELGRALAEADAAQREWRQTSFAERRRCLQEAARLLRSGRAGDARLATLEMGKPIAEAEGETTSAPGTASSTPTRQSGSWPTSTSRPTAASWPRSVSASSPTSEPSGSSAPTRPRRPP
jgi:acyl-CoA reductase-like NAD-dependent aldehyde dehydrogenase